MSSASTSTSTLTVDSDNCTSLSIIILDSKPSISPLGLPEHRLKNTLHVDRLAQLIGVPMHHFLCEEVGFRPHQSRLHQCGLARPGRSVEHYYTTAFSGWAQQRESDGNARPVLTFLRRNLFE